MLVSSNCGGRTTFSRFASEKKISAWQESVCVAIYAISQPIVQILRFPNPFSKAVLHELLTSLEVVQGSKRHRSLHLWLLLIAAYLSCQMENWKRITEDFSRTSRCLGLHSSSEVETMLLGLSLPLPNYQDTLKAIWTCSNMEKSIVVSV